MREVAFQVLAGRQDEAAKAVSLSIGYHTLEQAVILRDDAADTVFFRLVKREDSDVILFQQSEFLLIHKVVVRAEDTGGNRMCGAELLLEL